MFLGVVGFAMIVIIVAALIRSNLQPIRLVPLKCTLPRH